jgi:hypothetical protein
MDVRLQPKKAGGDQRVTYDDAERRVKEMGLVNIETPAKWIF